jgi:transposase
MISVLLVLPAETGLADQVDSGPPNRRQHEPETTRRSNPEEKWQIVQEGMKSGNVSETCRRHGIAQTLYYRWKDEAEQGAKAALGGRSAAAAETEKDRRIRQLERTLGRKSLEIEILKNAVEERAAVNFTPRRMKPKQSA